MKVAINQSVGGFEITKECCEYLASKGFEEAQELLDWNNNEAIRDKEQFEWCGYLDVVTARRSDSLFIEAIEKFPSFSPKIVEIPDDVEFYIYEDEMGFEVIHEKHRTWF